MKHFSNPLLWLLLAFALFFLGLGSIGFVGPDEPRYASIAREMARSGDWITPRLWGEPWFEKPPLLYWMSAAAFRSSRNWARSTSGCCASPACGPPASAAAIRAWSGMGGSARLAYRCLTPSQVKELGAGSLVDIGAHSVSHAVLSKLSLDEQRKEICESRDQLEQIVGRRVTAFAYPYGTQADYGSETAGLLRETGFAVGCSNFPGVIRKRHDVFQLPRFIVRDWDQDTFAENLDCWFAGKMETTSHGS